MNDDLIMPGIIGGFILLVIGIVWLLVGVAKEYNADMAQCLADGHKEYECHAMLRGHSSSTTPIFIPLGR